jgi:D-psicose/D-tagatose/L-ribulose 3-epimerase
MQGFKRDEPDRNTANARTVEGLKQVADYAAARGVTLVLEPVNRFEVGHNHTAAQVLDLVDRIGSPALTIMLDTFHINIEESSLDGPVHLVGNRLGHVHVFENHRGLFGTGHMDLGRILRATLEIGYRGYWVFGDFSPNSLPVRAAAALDLLQRARLLA